MFELITITTGGAKLVELIRMCRPQAVLFDLTMPHPDFAISLLLEQPDLLLIGMDPSSTEVLVLSNQSAQIRSIADLLRIIGLRGSKSRPVKRKGKQAMIFSPNGF